MSEGDKHSTGELKDRTIELLENLNYKCINNQVFGRDQRLVLATVNDSGEVVISYENSNDSKVNECKLFLKNKLSNYNCPFVQKDKENARISFKRQISHYNSLIEKLD